ncbi:hypothetical protein H4R18_004304 [Coemansia javaensis]|uniref:Uncharacterized protein n=1 Tax=Coemansia javaensis TaxID=2761396 RepID=A0A9W8H6J0_9FUNG|nr:hypothetical protein H4R18_004304 [Coemansia javaensis]
MSSAAGPGTPGLAMVPTSPGLSIVSVAGESSIALTRGQFAVECGGVLLDPATSEVCLLFYPDTSEWRLPIGRPEWAPGAPSTAGCEPAAHAAQRQISRVTGYRCSHVHPRVAAQGDAQACAYAGPHMVEPLALQIEQRTGAARASVDGEHAEPGGAYEPGGQFVMTYYYLAWLTQNRFESKAATHPVGPATPELADSTVNRQPPRTLPLAEVTWFKMDTAAQVLTHSADKIALREAIHRLSRLPAPAPPFAYSAVLQPAEAAPGSPAAGEAAASDSASHTSRPAGPGGEAQQQQQQQQQQQTPPPQPSSSSSSSSALSDNATKADNGSRALSPVHRNIDLIRKTATSLSKRRGMFSTRRRAHASDAATDPPPAATPAEPEAPAARPQVPRVLSMFYRLVGSSSA